MKKEFKVDDRVKLVNLGGTRLENSAGTILGKSFVNVVDHYIVLLDQAQPEAKAVCVTEACLEKIT